MRAVKTFAPIVLATSALGCAAIPVHMHTETTMVGADGKLEHTSRDWEGTLDQLPGELARAGAELGHLTTKLAKQLTDVPPPGKVKLRDLGPGLERFEASADTNFLLGAKTESGEKEDFEYVRLGVESYDEFFRTAQELHALTWQATQTTSHMRQFAGRATKEKLSPGADLKAAVSKASGMNAQAKTKLTGLADMSVVLGTLVPQMAAKSASLVTAGEKLVAGAPASLTNPKVVTHLGLVKKGLLASISVVRESGAAMVGLGADLAPFSKSASLSPEWDPLSRPSVGTAPQELALFPGLTR
ncbi:MAG TPA: hypothetical protein PK141_09715 [Polyangiaceae bacterium]|nr:hypothetical protein [Polyangiaceae bacterium]